MLRVFLRMFVLALNACGSVFKYRLEHSLDSKVQMQLSNILRRLRKSEVMRRVHNARTNQDNCKQIHAHLDASLRGAALLCPLRGLLISSFSLPFGLSLTTHLSLCSAPPTLSLSRFCSRVPRVLRHTSRCSGPGKKKCRASTSSISSS